MKVTSNLSFLLRISSVVMPVVESIKGFGRKLSAATKPTSTIKHRELFDFAAAAQQHSNRGLKSALAPGLSQKRSAVTKRALKHQKALADSAVHEQNRGLQQADLTDPAVCEAFLTLLVGSDSACTCTEEGPSTECIDYLATCNFCDTLQGETACISSSFTEDTPSVFSSCITYKSGPFDNVICQTENRIDNTCTYTIDGTECSSCTVIDCDGESDYDIDCSNIIAGETWNLCTADIPETSMFLPFGSNNGRYRGDPICSEAGLGGGGEPDLTDPALCEAFLTLLVGPDSGCTCAEEEPSTECIDYLATCNFCDTLQGEDACISISLTEDTSSVVSGCITYESGPFDNVICETENFIDNTCTITIDGTECSSCTVIDCDGDTDYDIDCSNIIAGETWNLCTDTIPETSRFLAAGNNDRFEDPDCSEAGGGKGALALPTGGGNDSGGKALSFHVLSVVSLIAVAAFW
jgi:hypothetical protein